MKINLDYRSKILETLNAVADEGGKELTTGFNENTALLESGLDSLDFAIVVARLERELGFDPFSQSDQPIYPHTFQDLIDVYTNHQPA
ncbi:hypothetical protein Enr13x_21380 [Stieleria neptunia]|uniref:Carrier domain-containing protein n=1 Tax=Stieleria neptunia TaxID=2527979 RepID=A0A518HN73_9BACT|nr:acyl carrier protein [Stieleria neptunia]QDV42293.1 hypothetical protein Enr13x_21380 [Stieleria neptunia]